MHIIIRPFFQIVPRVIAKIIYKVRKFLHICSHIYIYTLISLSIPSIEVAHLFSDDSTLTFYYYSESIVYLSVFICCCTFHRFGQRYNDGQPLLTASLHPLPFHPSPPTLMTTDLFYCIPKFGLSGATQLESNSIEPSLLGFFHLVITFRCSLCLFIA